MQVKQMVIGLCLALGAAAGCEGSIGGAGVNTGQDDLSAVDTASGQLVHWGTWRRHRIDGTAGTTGTVTTMGAAGTTGAAAAFAG